ncbi:hypothetical protein Acr_08g0010290 [Actinidia rufa]|uniref:Uncharacterized protein n=1 Tax=Actinidia rufa TaxID=165716 RepID=A0A7J0F204_9ERIC|nr:hypothetical protein Acr_08g0010290 [Actinidia rufa]
MNALQAIGDSQTEIWRNPQADGCHSCCGLSGKIGLAAAAAACSTKPFFWLPPIASLTVTNYSTTKGMHLIWEAYLKTWEECLMMLQKT